MDYLKVSSKSSPASVAGAIAGMVKDGVAVSMQCVGAGAVNQAIKAIAIARGFLIPEGFDISCSPVFSEILIDEQTRTALRLTVNVHELRGPSSGLSSARDIEAASGATASRSRDRRPVDGQTVA